MTRFTICDDEPEHGRLIGKYIKTEYAKHVPETDIAEVVVYQSPQEMLDEAIEDTDIFILDIECGKSSGLDIAKEIRRLNKNAGIVFCTSHSNYVYQVFGLTPIDFIRKNNTLKDMEVLTIIINRIFKRRLDTILFEYMGRKTSLKVSEIIYAESLGHNVILHTIDNTYEFRSNFQSLLKKFDHVKFTRIHKSYVINDSVKYFV